jgi:hypothetical protein
VPFEEYQKLETREDLLRNVEFFVMSASIHIPSFLSSRHLQ